jgi:putative pyruvate formate lyase activating enzyme
MLSTIQMLEGIIEIYMPDAKYASEEVARELSDAPDYPRFMKEALKEMHRQVGDLQMDAGGIATSGLLVRHLVLPDDLAGTKEIMRFLAQEISRDTYVNIMDQYRPAFKAPYHLRMSRRVTSSEYQEAIQIALQEGLHRGFPDHEENRFLRIW